MELSDHVRSSSGTGTPNGRERPCTNPHQELEHLITMKAMQSSLDDDNKRAEDDDVEAEAIKTMMLKLKQ